MMDDSLRWANVGTDKQITYLQMDITTVTRGVVAHGVNCRGVMGSGVALAIREKWPSIYEPYKQLCAGVQNKGDLLKTVQVLRITDELYVANAFTQESYGYDGKMYAELGAVKYGFEMSVRAAILLDLPLYTVKVGSVRGGLSWTDDVEPFVKHLVNKYPSVDIYICDK
jgi:hypothetical protein